MLCLCRRSDEWFVCWRRWLCADIGKFGAAGLNATYVNRGRSSVVARERPGDVSKGGRQPTVKSRTQTAASRKQVPYRASFVTDMHPGAVSELPARCKIVQRHAYCCVSMTFQILCKRGRVAQFQEAAAGSAIYVPQARSWDVRGSPCVQL